MKYGMVQYVLGAYLKAVKNVMAKSVYPEYRLIDQKKILHHFSKIKGNRMVVLTENLFLTVGRSSTLQPLSASLRVSHKILAAGTGFAVKKYLE